LWERTGGPAASVTALCRALAPRHEVCLLTGDGPLHADVRALAGTVRVRVEPLGPYAFAHWSPRFAAACREEAARAEVVHDHGVWLHTNWSSAAAALGADRPLVRSPRGMLSPWALSRSRLRKGVLWRLRERSNFERASTVHATSALEQAELRALGIEAPIACIGNGIDTEGSFARSRLQALKLPLEAGERRRVVFLSRLDVKKGLDLLQDAWAALPSPLPVELLVAGSGDASMAARVRRWAQTQGGPPARYVGAVEGDAKFKLLANAFLFVLPSRSENYGMVVAEALAAGTPVVTTDRTPWTNLAARGCGWTIEPTVAALATALREALALDEDARARMGQSARQLIESEHSLAATAGCFEDLYASLGNRAR
jgi:glycosyltransferase involved in cell wall biosynthesis